MKKGGTGWHSQECSVFGMTIHMEKYLPQNYSMPVQSWYMFLNKSTDPNSD